MIRSTVDTYASLSSARKFGEGDNRSLFEKDGTLVFKGGATVWVDIDFPVVVRAPAANQPTQGTLQGNLTMPQWSVNDFYVCEAQELPHAWLEESTVKWHLHLWTNATDVTDRYVNWEVEYTWCNANSDYGSNVIITSGDYLIPANAPPSMYIIPIADAVLSGGKIAGHVKARLRRIASTGTAPTVNPFCEMLQLHIECDTVGSREVATK